MEIQYPLHEHPLKLVSMGSEEDERTCAGCDDQLSGEVYACDSCRLYLHQSCANLPPRIDHFIHPSCPLFLKLAPESRGGGGGGGETTMKMELWYHCEACNFGIDAACGQEKHRLFRPFFDHRSLRLRFAGEEGDPILKKHCRVCDELISGNYYTEEDVGNRDYYYLHESCGGHLPRKIRHFFHPSCTLSLKLFKLLHGRCGACEKPNIDAFLYHCQNCDFSMDAECTKFETEDEGERVQHMSHRHPLKLFDDANDGFETKCKICGRRISGRGDFVGCDRCKFYIHKSCMDLPLEIQHRCHPHPLSLKPIFSFSCHVCSNDPRIMLYECEKCRFKMDVHCAFFSKEDPQGRYDPEKDILHFCHHHPLQLFQDLQRNNTDRLMGNNLKCLVCQSSALGLTYGCRDRNCDVYIHKSCLGILPEILHTEDGSMFLNRQRHVNCGKCGKLCGRAFLFSQLVSNKRSWCIPCAMEEVLSFPVSVSSIFIKLHFHPCSLTLKLFSIFTCNACFTHCHTHAYYCEQCDFYVGAKCARASMESFEGRRQHFCHRHPLQLSQGMEDVSSASCEICATLCTSQPFYVCNECDFHIHSSCLDILPQKIEKHYFNCSLVLVTTPSYRCASCQKMNSSTLAFRSIERGFELCMRCVLWPENKQNDDGSFISIHHWHELTLVEKLEEDANCLLCGARISTFSYCCSQCQDYFHKACAEMPLVMHHSLHKQDALELISSHLLPEPRSKCSLCQGDLLFTDPHSHHSGVYHCKECGFQLDKKCATFFPSIQYQNHPHPLTIVENMQGQEVCQVCSISCLDKMVFRCPESECNFNLHLTCGPLPYNIKHSCHVHSLVLEDFYVEENYTDLFPCHVCEERRDPRVAVYVCTEGCPMICEIKCLTSEVMPKLLGAHAAVELRTTFPNVVSKVITKDDGLIDMTYDQSTTSSRQKVGDFPAASALEFLLKSSWTICAASSAIHKWEYEMKRSNGIELEREDEDMFTFSREALDHFSSKLECTHLTLRREGIPEFITQHNGPAVRGEYILPETLIPIYEEYFGGNNSVIETLGSCSEGQTFKSLFVFIVCAVLHNMRTTKLVDVTNERVLQWLTMLKLVEVGGFNIGFIYGKIQLVWESHFLIKAKAIVDGTSARLDARSKELSRREKELLRELEDTRKEMAEVNELEKRHHKYAGDGMKSLRKEYARTLLTKWKPATSFIVDSKDQLRNAMKSSGLYLSAVVLEYLDYQERELRKRGLAE